MDISLEAQGTDDDGWLMFKTSLGDIIRIKQRPDGGYDIRFPADKYELKEIYNVESTGDVVIDLVPKKPAQ